MTAEVRVMNEDWDFLIVLDACRYDYFEKLNFFGGELEKRVSLGSSTWEWVENNFSGFYPDTIYVSGNPWVSITWMKDQMEYDFIPFPYIDRVWDYGYDMNLFTVPPESVTRAALKDKERFPKYKMIVHYLQPHHPFIGHWEGLEEVLQLSWEKGKGIWELLMDGIIGPEVVQTAYEKNLVVVLWAVSELIEELDGEIVITSDHGNCFGEHGLYGHPKGKRVGPLVEVPWFRVEEYG